MPKVIHTAGQEETSMGSDLTGSRLCFLSTAHAASPPESVSCLPLLEPQLEWGELCAPQLWALCKESLQKPSCPLAFKAGYQQNPHAFLPSFLIPRQLPKSSSNAVLDHQATLQRIKATCFPLALISSSPHRSVVCQGKIMLLSLVP